jgi:glutamyl-tRNA synthetase
MSTPVVTRFAPSPTGFLHIGGGRTALFNWLYAKKHGGKMLLRIEDTDRERSTDAAIDAIIDGLKWLGITWDGDTVFQFARAARHREVAEQLLAEGKAYYCYASAEELTQMREAARAEGRSKLYNGLWRDRDASTPKPDVKPTIRLKAPLTGETVIEDQVQGRVVWQNENLDDLVLLRGDGTPTYMLAVVVDDHDMGVTHVIRGDDHLINAARQKQIYDALGWDVPSMSHIPLIHGPDGAKLSKRHGAQAVHEYAEMGYLPEAMRNYLARLGWAHGDDELFSDAQAIEWFDLAGIGKAPARLDFDKLAHVNSHWLRLADDERLAKLTLDAHLQKGHALAEADEARLQRAMPFVKDRAKTILDLADQTAFVLKSRPLTQDDKAKALMSGETLERLGRLRERLSLFQSWDVFALEAELKAFAESEGVGFGKIGPPVRAALTAGSTSPDIARTLSALGRDESLGRLDDALQQTK